MTRKEFAFLHKADGFTRIMNPQNIRSTVNKAPEPLKSKG